MDSLSLLRSELQQEYNCLQGAREREGIVDWLNQNQDVTRAEEEEEVLYLIYYNFFAGPGVDMVPDPTFEVKWILILSSKNNSEPEPTSFWQ